MGRILTADEITDKFKPIDYKGQANALKKAIGEVGVIESIRFGCVKKGKEMVDDLKILYNFLYFSPERQFLY